MPQTLRRKLIGIPNRVVPTEHDKPPKRSIARQIEGRAGSRVQHDERRDDESEYRQVSAAKGRYFDRFSHDLAALAAILFRLPLLRLILRFLPRDRRQPIVERGFVTIVQTWPHPAVVVGEHTARLGLDGLSVVQVALGNVAHTRIEGVGDTLRSGVAGLIVHLAGS
jgi:hypothetical protein